MWWRSNRSWQRNRPAHLVPATPHTGRASDPDPRTCSGTHPASCGFKPNNTPIPTRPATVCHCRRAANDQYWQVRNKEQWWDSFSGTSRCSPTDAPHHCSVASAAETPPWLYGDLFANLRKPRCCFGSRHLTGFSDGAAAGSRPTPKFLATVPGKARGRFRLIPLEV